MQSSVLKKTSAVTALSVLKRALGFFYRIALSRMLGAEGVGLYQTATAFFFAFVTLGAGGIPVTVSRLTCKSKVAGKDFKPKNVLSSALTLSLIVCLPLSVLFVFFGDFLPLPIDKRAVLPLRALFLGLVFSCASHAFRGAFWGQKKLLTPSVIELIEECLTVFIGIALLCTASTTEQGVFRACIAVAITDGICFIVSLICYKKQGGKFGSPTPSLMPLLRSATPVTAVRFIGSISTSLVAVLFPLMLIKGGFGESESIQIFGVVSGMTLPVLTIPTTVIGALAFVLVPELSERFYQKDFSALARQMERGLFACVAVACVFIPFFAVFGDYLGRMLFQSALAGGTIARGAWLLLPMSLSMLVQSFLNSMGFERHTFLFSLVGDAVTLALIFLLPPLLGADAFFIAIGGNAVVCSVCGLAFLFRFLKPSKAFWKAVGFCLLFCVATICLFLPLFTLLASRLSALPSVLVGGACMAIATATGYLSVFAKQKIPFFWKKSQKKSFIP